MKNNIIKQDNFKRFEDEVMQKIIKEDTKLYQELKKQYEKSKVTNREFTGYGFYTNFEITDKSLRLESAINIELGSTHATINDVKNGVGFVLFIRNGLIEMLEGYTYEERWPQEIKQYSIY